MAGKRFLHEAREPLDLTAATAVFVIRHNHRTSVLCIMYYVDMDDDDAVSHVKDNNQR